MYNYRLLEYDSEENLTSDTKYTQEEFEAIIKTLDDEWDVIENSNDIRIWQDKYIGCNMGYIKWNLINKYGFKEVAVQAGCWIRC